MLFLPWGLQTRLFKIPWGILSLGLGIVFLSIQNFWIDPVLSADSMVTKFIIQTMSFDTPFKMLTSLLLLGLFGVYVDLRIGAFFTLLTFYLGGAATFVLQGFIFKNYQFSPSIMALNSLMGAFFLLFAQTNYRIVVLMLPKIKKVFLVPSFLFLFLIQTFVVMGYLFFAKTYPYPSLLGLVVGSILGVIWSQVSYVQNGALFPEEVLLLLKAKKEADPLKKIDHILECLKINLSNPQALQYLFRSIAKAKVAAYFFTDDQKKIIADLVTSIIKQHVKVETNIVIYAFSILPLNWNMTDLGIQDLNQNDLDFIDEILEKSEWRVALRLYDVYLMCESDEDTRAIVIATLQTLIDSLKRQGIKENEEEWLKEYSEYHPHSYASSIIKTSIKFRESSEVA